jgi:transcriptional regulator with XRE-family HTH domain
MPASDKKLDRLVADLGEAVRERRQGKNISQEALAEIADFDRTYISLLERGARNQAGMVAASV